LPERTRVPAPFFVSPNPEPEIAPPTVKVFADTVRVRVAFIATAPVPRSRLFEHVKVKSLFQFCVLFVIRMRELPEVLSIVAAPPMTRGPVPMAEALLIRRVPALRVVPPLWVLLPERVRIELLFLTSEPFPEIAPERI
jgi:hypothetical protein